MYSSRPSQSENPGAQAVDSHRGTAQRLLRDLFGLDLEHVLISDMTTLSDLVGHVLAGKDPAASARAWAIRVKEQVFAHFGIDCEADEPLLDLLVRLESAERGVRVSHLA
jgi:Ribonuclease G/E